MNISQKCNCCMKESGCVEQELGWCDGRCSVVEKAPQSWCYVEENENERT